nr:PREDICTED: mRNA turnover protein 4 homolog [Bemisia tabaci]
MSRKLRKLQEYKFTEVKKKGKELKSKLINEIRNALNDYEHIFLFNLINMRSNKVKELRNHWKKNSRFFFGKSRVMAVALGRTAEAESLENIHKIGKRIKPHCGLMFTNESKEKVIDWFKRYNMSEYPKAGFIPSSTLTLPAGDIPTLGASQEPYLRVKLGLPTLLKNGVIHLLSDYTLCKKDKPVSPEQAKLLKLLGHKIATFKINLKYVWSRDGTVECLYDKENASKLIRSQISDSNEQESDDEEAMELVITSDVDEEDDNEEDDDSDNDEEDENDDD